MLRNQLYFLLNQFLVDFFNYLKKKLSGNAEYKGITLELSRIEDSFKRAIVDAAQTNTPTEEAGVRYEIFNHNGKKVETDWDSDNYSSLSSQLKNNIHKIENMEIVDDVHFNHTDGKSLRVIAMNLFKKIGFKVDVQIKINGEKGYVVVAVKVAGKTRYNAHRILMPDGSEFVLDNKKDTELQSARVNNKNIVQRSANSSVSIYSMPEVPTKVNTQNSIPDAKSDLEYLNAVECGDMETAQRLVDEAAKKVRGF